MLAKFVFRVDTTNSLSSTKTVPVRNNLLTQSQDTMSQVSSHKQTTDTQTSNSQTNKRGRENFDCTPNDDEFNPCEDIFGFDYLQIVVLFVVAASLSGNFLVIIVLISVYFKSKLSVPRFLQLNLAIADFCTGLYLLLLTIADRATRQSYFKYAMTWQFVGCKFAGGLSIYASQLSIYTLTVITFDRYLAIIYSIDYNMRLKLNKAVRIMAIGWIFAITAALLPIFTEINTYSMTSICLPMRISYPRDKIYLFLLLLIDTFAFSAILFCYIQMYLLIRRQKSQASLNERAIARRMALLVSVDFVCWAPIIFYGIAGLCNYPLIGVSKAKILLVYFFPLNSVANPFLYAILTRQYQRDCTNLVGKIIKKVRQLCSIKYCFSFFCKSKNVPIKIGKSKHNNHMPNNQIDNNKNNNNNNNSNRKSSCKSWQLQQLQLLEKHHKLYQQQQLVKLKLGTTTSTSNNTSSCKNSKSELVKLANISSKRLHGSSNSSANNNTNQNSCSIMSGCADCLAVACKDKHSLVSFSSILANNDNSTCNTTTANQQTGSKTNQLTMSAVTLASSVSSEDTFTEEEDGKCCSPGKSNKDELLVAISNSESGANVLPKASLVVDCVKENSIGMFCSKKNIDTYAGTRNRITKTTKSPKCKVFKNSFSDKNNKVCTQSSQNDKLSKADSDNLKQFVATNKVNSNRDRCSIARRQRNFYDGKCKICRMQKNESKTKYQSIVDGRQNKTDTSDKQTGNENLNKNKLNCTINEPHKFIIVQNQTLIARYKNKKVLNIQNHNINLSPQKTEDKQNKNVAVDTNKVNC